MKRYIQYPRVAGTASRQAHADLPPGTYEREMGKEGFFGPAAFFHHRHPPTGWTRFDGPLRPHAFDLTRLATPARSPWDAAALLENAHCRLRWLLLDAPMDHLARNADGDELLFVHAGTASLYCDFGHLAIEAGDYVVLPRGTMWRLETAAPLRALLIEATNASYLLPEKGLVGAQALFDPAMLDVPALDEPFRAQQDRGPPGAPAGERGWQVRIKRRQQVSTAHYPFNPLDAIGWHGDLAVCRINVRDLRPQYQDLATQDPSADLYKTSTDACCHIRKVLPLDRALQDFDAWITGRKRFQSGTRLSLPVVEEGEGKIKFNPLANWSKSEIDAYAREHELPAHPLVQFGYPSIGCWPCTHPVEEGEDARSGRWQGQDKVECGIHVVRAPAPSNDGVGGDI